MTQAERNTQYFSKCASFHVPSVAQGLVTSPSHRYGGPGSQTVNVQYKRDWHDYLVCTLQYIVVVVDGRGTGFKGRQLRNPVRDNLGFWETVDQINAARYMRFFFDQDAPLIFSTAYGQINLTLTQNALVFGAG